MSENGKTDTNKKRRRGAPLGNKNAVGNLGGNGAPFGNKYALKHGKYTGERKKIKAKRAEWKRYFNKEIEEIKEIQRKIKANFEEYKQHRNNSR